MATLSIKADPRLDGWVVTNPAHGGKVDCHKCIKWIYYNEAHVVVNEWCYFHYDCYNPYEHYYGIDKPID